MNDEIKSVVWLGDSLEQVRQFPEPVKQTVGFALHQAQEGGKHPDAKPLKGFKSAGVLEIIENYDTDTYRTVYTVRMKTVIYVVHAFQKKSKRGISTPRTDMNMITRRMKEAEMRHMEWVKGERNEP